MLRCKKKKKSFHLLVNVEAVKRTRKVSRNAAIPSGGQECLHTPDLLVGK